MIASSLHVTASVWDSAWVGDTPRSTAQRRNRTDSSSDYPPERVRYGSFKAAKNLNVENTGASSNGIAIDNRPLQGQRRSGG